MGEARRRKLAGTYPQRDRVDWTDPRNRAGFLNAVMEGMARDNDPTLRGCTVILPDREPVYLSVETAKRGGGKPDA